MDKLILSYNDSCLYESDLQILKSDRAWLSDRIISFYFEYLQLEILKNDFEILLIGPEVTQAIKLMNNPEEANAIFLEPLSASSRQFIIFAINNNSSFKAGGSHWSLCVFSKADNTFYHFDSNLSSNFSSCASLVKTLGPCFNCKISEIKEVDCLQQNNGYDCGIFVLCHAELVCLTIKECKSIESVTKLQSEKVHSKRNEVIQLIRNLSES